MSPSPYYKLETFVPEESVDEILAALAGTHAGEIGSTTTAPPSSPCRQPGAHWKVLSR